MTTHEQALAEGQEDIRCERLSDEQMQLLREDLRLQVSYAGQYVAYRDCWSDDGGAMSLRREVLASDSNPAHMKRQLQSRMRDMSLSEADIEQQFVESPGAGISDRHDLAG